MKKILLFTLLAAVGLTGCETYHETYHGIRGEYGFTYDLHNTPSPFVDTSYRPLTPFDLAAPMIVVVTNQPPPKLVYQESPQIGETRYAGETPARAPVTGAAAPTIVESAGAQPGQPGQAATGPGTAGAAAPTAAQPFYGTGGDVFIAPGTNVVQTNTNVMATNIISTNTNAFGMVTNTNVIGGITNTNAVAAGTNAAINEPAGTALRTNRPFGEPAGTQFRTNRFGEPPVPPKAATNRVLFVPQTATPTPQTQTPGTGVPQQQPLAVPQGTSSQSPVQQQQQQLQQQQQQRIQTGPPASAPQSPPAPMPPSSPGAPNSPFGGATPPSGTPSSP